MNFYLGPSFNPFEESASNGLNDSPRLPFDKLPFDELSYNKLAYTTN